MYVCVFVCMMVLYCFLYVLVSCYNVEVMLRKCFLIVRFFYLFFLKATKDDENTE